jgi:cystathionine beta-lyase/cystathionine gamma-synthase
VAYGGTYRICTKILTKFGIEFTFADGSDIDAVAAAVRDNTKLILTETPANPTMKCSDIAAISEIARKAGAVHAVDNTFKSDEHAAAVRFIQNSTGSIMSPQVAWLTLQGCKTLSVRMDAQSESAMAIATFLEAHPKVEQVMYPGLESFPQHELSSKQASGYGAMLWFEVKGGLAAGKKLMDNINVWSLAENLGSVESLITHPVTMTHADVEPEERARVGIIDGLVRASVGLEDTDDLIDALAAALEQV